MAQRAFSLPCCPLCNVARACCRTVCRTHAVELLSLHAAAPMASATQDAEKALLDSQRIFGCELIQKMGILLRLPQVAVSTAQVSFHRFYAKRSMRKFDVRYYAVGALFLSTKVEECPRKMRDVLSVFMHLEQKRKKLTPQPTNVYSERYSAYKDRLIKAEREILKELGFILYTEHPHKFIFNYVKLLVDNEVSLKKLSQYAWNFVNDSQRTDACIHYAPEAICCAALWMGARVLQIKLPSTAGALIARSPASPRAAAVLRRLLVWCRRTAHRSDARRATYRTHVALRS